MEIPAAVILPPATSITEKRNRPEPIKTLFNRNEVNSKQLQLKATEKISSIDHLLEKNERWVDKMMTKHPKYFECVSKQITPKILWIGCIDSKISANQLVDIHPGELLVLQTFANIFLESDKHALAVLQYALEMLQIKHIIVCGHENCNCLEIAYYNKNKGVIADYLNHVHSSETLFDQSALEGNKFQRVAENSIKKSIENIKQTLVYQKLLKRGEKISFYAWQSNNNGRLFKIK